MPRPPLRALSLLFLLFIPGFAQAGEDDADNSTKVTATVKLPAELASFAESTLELRLYEFDPRLADAAANLVEKIEEVGFSHTSGTATERKIEIGAKGELKRGRGYYLTTFVLKGSGRTHIGERDGKPGLCKVLTDGNPREVTIVVRAVR